MGIEKAQLLIDLNAFWNERTKYLYYKSKTSKHSSHLYTRQIMECDYVLGKVLEMIEKRRMEKELIKRS